MNNCHQCTLQLRCLSGKIRQLRSFVCSSCATSRVSLNEELLGDIPRDDVGEDCHKLFFDEWGLCDTCFFDVKRETIDNEMAYKALLAKKNKENKDA